MVFLLQIQHLFLSFAPLSFSQQRCTFRKILISSCNFQASLHLLSPKNIRINFESKSKAFKSIQGGKRSCHSYQKSFDTAHLISPGEVHLVMEKFNVD